MNNKQERISTSLPTHYTLADVLLQRGSFYNCQRCINVKNGEEYSAKIIDIGKLAEHQLSLEDIKSEVELFKTLSHPNIVQIYDGYEVDASYIIISEIITGCDLLQEILNKSDNGFVYSETVASYYIRQIIDGICYLHTQNIVHRNLKLECLMLSSSDDAAPVKITDCDHAIKLDSDEMKSIPIGGTQYMSPEMLNQQNYGCLTDIWSCGVILYTLLAGSFPFNILEASNQTYQVQMTSTQWEFISDTAKELVFGMLQADTKNRLSAKQVLQHPWLKDGKENAERYHLSETITELQITDSERKKNSCSSSTRQNISLSKSSNVPDVSYPGSYWTDQSYDISNTLEGFMKKINEVQEIKEYANREDIAFLNCLILNDKLKLLLKIRSLTEKVSEKCNIKDLSPTSYEALYEVNVSLNTLGYTTDHAVLQLKDILQNPHIMALLHTNDSIIKEMNNKSEKTTCVKNEMNITEHSDQITRVRLVQFPKYGDEPLGVTLKLNHEKHCVVARILHGGMIHRQGTLHVGDEIREIDGIDISRLALEKVQRHLKAARGDIAFKIVPSPRLEEKKDKQLYVRCLFDYDPYTDDLIPCQQAGLSFHSGDIIEVVSKRDSNWWQGMKQNTERSTGIIPSPELHELRISNAANDKNKAATTFDKLALLTYEEVTQRDKFSRKTLILLGAHGVGRRHIKNSLISRFGEKFAYPLPHTSRKPAAAETNGECWYFESEENMLAQISKHEFLEYGQHEGSLYGTKLSTIRHIIKDGKIPVLDPETPTLKILRCKEFSPYIIFISSPTTFSNTGDPKMDSSLQRLINESNDLQTRYKHYFDHVIVNNSIEDTVEDLLNHLNSIKQEPEWCPTSWMY